MSLATKVPPKIRSRWSGKSLWRLRYTDGRIVTEGEVDWSLAPTRGRQAVQLICPNGQVAELGSTRDCTGRLFQFKCADTFHGTVAHVIGIITGTDGQAEYAAWEYGPERLVTGEDNAFNFRYQNVGRIAADHVGITPD